MYRLKDLFYPYVGSSVADAVAMPVHWYYDLNDMDAVYGRVNHYRAPLTPHNESILERSQYQARNAKGEILHNQAVFWGRTGVHYHQFLPAGGSTLNFQLSAELLSFVSVQGYYSTESWLEHYVKRMLTPGWHNDTFLDVWHRGFFDNYSRGLPLLECSPYDKQISGLTCVPALLYALTLTESDQFEEYIIGTVVEHLSLTYRHRHVLAAAESFCRILLAIRGGYRIRDAIDKYAQQWGSAAEFEAWSCLDDRTVVGEVTSRASYLPESYSAALYLAYKYASDFTGGILANAYCGGDSCHRGAIVGAILAAAHGVDPHWINGLQNRTVRRSFELCYGHLQDDRQLCIA